MPLFALLEQLQALSPKEDGTCGRLSVRNATGDFLGEALLSEKAVEALTAWTTSLNTCLKAEPPEPAPAAAEPEPATQGGTEGDGLDPLLLAALEDHFEAVDPMSYMADVYAAEHPEAAEAAFEQLVTGEWDGEL
ncbi:hypothetical protein [Streptomyces sp. NPDC001205]